MRRAILIPFTVIFVACAGGGSVQQHAASVPISEQASTGEAAHRAKTHTELGLNYFQVGNLGVALQEARTAVSADTSYAPAFNLMGVVHMTLGENQQAKDAFEQAIRLAPGDSEIANNYGLFLCKSGRESEGLQQFLTAVKNPLYKTPSIPFTNAGLCALRLKDDKTAEVYFQRAVNADGTNAQAFFRLAEIAYRRADFYSARKYIGEVHSLAEPNSESLWLGVRIERKIGDRQAEASHSSQLRRKFAGTPEHQAMQQGKFE